MLAIGRANVPPPGFPDFEIRPRTTPARPGDEDPFSIQCGDREAFDKLFTADRMELLLRELRQAELWCDRNRLHLRIVPGIIRASLLDAACELLWGLLAVDRPQDGVFR